MVSSPTFFQHLYFYFAEFEPEEKELNTGDGATVTIHLPSARKSHSDTSGPTSEHSSLLAKPRQQQGTRLSVDCDLSSDDENF